ncbi:MAG TPA: putative C-S lyase, partial [Aliarcobacter thereius]|nr:putative C-S lyase [Aliarcobacter thereius]
GIESTISAYEYCEDWLEELLIYLEKNRDFLENFIAKNIPNIKVIKAEATYLMWLDISNFGLDSTTFTKKLEEIGKVRVISGSTFGENGDNFIRVNIACPKKILEQALNALKFTIENL